MIPKLILPIISLFVCFVVFGANAQDHTPFVWNGDTLIIDDHVSEQGYLWKNGSLRPLFSNAKQPGSVRKWYKSKIDLVTVPKEEFLSSETAIEKVGETKRSSAFYQLSLKAVLEHGEIAYIVKVFKDCPGTEWVLASKGQITANFAAKISQEQQAIEDVTLLSGSSVHYFHLPFSTRHQLVNVVQFREATDHNNNLVYTQPALPYSKEQFFSGNVITVEDPVEDEVSLVVKLSPLGYAQANYSGLDYGVDFAGLKVFSTGFDTTTANWQDEWHRSYPLYMARHAKSETQALLWYKEYELTVHRYLPEQDNTFTMNTWGNRNRDSRINEQFILNELDKAAALGITHYQIDDGWQHGLSQNSSQNAGVLWDDWSVEDWGVNSTRFPNGLEKVQQKAEQNKMQLGLWFNPSKNNNYQNWERDRNILVNLYNRHKVSWIKIDGIQIGNKTAEKRVGDMLNTASQQTGGKLQFNMDVTAGKRGGYFFLNRVGNIFLENRYTDWANFYPHFALRNAWQLSRYTPIQRFQIEWLDKWRNDNKYPKDDLLKPSQIPFDYQFAVTMMAQPLAWMEAAALPEEAFAVKSLIEVWKRERGNMQSGIVHPIGDMPNGFGFTGFASLSGSRVYVLVFREKTDTETFTFSSPFGDILFQKFHKLWGEAEISQVNENGQFTVNFAKPFSFLWGYFEF